MIKHPTERVVIFGFGAQGKSQALNLRDNSWPVSIYLRPASKRCIKVKEAGLLLYNDIQKATAECEIAVLLIPDSEQPLFYKEVLEPYLPEGTLIVFAHGFTVHYELIKARSDLDIALVAPMAHGLAVRNDFTAGKGAPVLIAVAQDATGRARERALQYARAISHTGPFIDTTFAEEVETDLFAEQAVLCGGLPELVQAAFDTLVKEGHNPDIAYLCCMRELRAIINVMDQYGIVGLFERISSTARYGALTRGPRVINQSVRETLKTLMKEIQSGKFAKEAMADAEKGYEISTNLLNEARSHQIEQIHAKFIK